jgi:hypothetical protein
VCLAITEYCRPTLRQQSPISNPVLHSSDGNIGKQSPVYGELGAEGRDRCPDALIMMIG